MIVLLPTMVMSSRLQEHGQTAAGKTKELGEALGHNSPREQKTLNECQTESPITGGGRKGNSRTRQGQGQGQGQGVEQRDCSVV